MSAEIRDVDTWGMPVGFAPRQHESGACWILIEQRAEPTLPILDEGFMGVHLAEGTTWKQAMILADLLSRRVTHLLYTGPIHAAWADNPGFGARAKRRGRDARASFVVRTLRFLTSCSPRDTRTKQG